VTLRRVLLSITMVVIASVPFQGVAQAHRSGCHRWHSCPSDTGSYVCGDLGYACQYPTYPEPKRTAKPKRKPTVIFPIVPRYTPPPSTPAPTVEPSPVATLVPEAAITSDTNNPAAAVFWMLVAGYVGFLLLMALVEKVRTRRRWAVERGPSPHSRVELGSRARRRSRVRPVSGTGSWNARTTAAQCPFCHRVSCICGRRAEAVE
jgi:hypothetical protein